MFWHRVNRSTTTFTYLMLAIIFPMHVLINRELPNVHVQFYIVRSTTSIIIIF